MKHLKIIAIVGVALFFVIVLFFFFGRELLYKKLPDLHESKWKSISVEYLTGENKSVKQTWSTTDQMVLDQLQSSLQVLSGGDLWGAGMMLSNKIEIRLANGKRWTIYISEPAKLTINDSLTPERGFGLDVTPNFYNTLKTIIESAKKESVYFY